MNRITKDATYTLGDEYVGLSLPTDIFSSARYLLMTGAGIKTNRFDTDIVAFGGMSAAYMGSSLFDGLRAEKPAAMLSLNHMIDRDWSTTTDVLITQRATLSRVCNGRHQKTRGLRHLEELGQISHTDLSVDSFTGAGLMSKPRTSKLGTSFTSSELSPNIAQSQPAIMWRSLLRQFKFLSFSGGRQIFLYRPMSRLLRPPVR